MENTTMTDSDKFICDLCGKEFDSASEHEEHLAQHTHPARAEREEISDIRGDIGAAGLPTSPIQ